MTRGQTSIMAIVQQSAPIVCALLLLGLIAFQQSTRIPREVIEQYHARIKEAASHIPYKIDSDETGDWIGTDVEVTPAAQKLLKPNVLFQRRYRNELTGRSVDLLLVHCGYIDDMGGHYPPVCYPAHGWLEMSRQHTDIRFGPTQYAGRLYEFEKASDGQRSQIRITNFFIVPSREMPILRDRDELQTRGEVRERSELGAAQVQIVTDSDMPADERERAVARFLEVIEPVFRVIGDGIQ